MKNLPYRLNVIHFFTFITVLSGLLGFANAQPYTIKDTFRTNGIFKVPAGVTSITIESWGGGGAGGGNNDAKPGGGGGGGGAYTKVTGYSVTPGDNIAVVVGAGGVGVSKGNGGNGGDSYIGNYICRASGGAGGKLDGTGGVGGKAYKTYYGGDGANGKKKRGGGGGSSAGTSANGVNGSGTSGGTAPAGGGNGGDESAMAGDFPGGGGGGSEKQDNGKGGDGAAGMVTITYTLSSVTTLYWAGAGSNIGGTTGVDFNLAANWSVSPNSYASKGQVPNATYDIVIRIEVKAATTLPINLTFSQANTEINNLDFSLKNVESNSSSIQEAGLSLDANQMFTIQGNAILYAESNFLDEGVQLTMDCKGDNAVFVYNGDLTTSAVENAVGSSEECIVYPFSNPVGTMQKGKFILRGNADLQGCGDDQYPQLNKPATLVFDGTGTQVIYNHNNGPSGLPGYPVFLAYETKIGETNAPTVVLTGPEPMGFRSIESLTISPNATLIVEPSQILDCDTTALTSPGAFTMGANSTLIVKGNNFPVGYSSYSLDPTSTVQYSSADGVNQNILDVAYGNIVLTNSTGSGNSDKNLVADLTVKGGMSVQSFVTLNQLGHNISRVPSGAGTFSLLSSAVHKLTGTYPNGFTTYALASDSYTDYSGGTQDISPQSYGHLLLENAGTKTAKGDVEVRRNLTISSGAIFDGGNYNHVIGGDWANYSSASAFVYGSGSVTFNGTSAQSIGGSYGTSFYKLVMGNTSASGITLDQPVDIYAALTANGSGRKLNTNDKLTLKSTQTRTAYVGNMTGNTINGKATVERYVSAHKAWRLMSIPTNSSQTIKEAWQEGASNSSENPKPGYGIQITGEMSNWASKGFDDHSYSPSMKSYNPSNNSWVGITSTNSGSISDSRAYMVFVRGDRLADNIYSTPTQTNLRTLGNIRIGAQPDIHVAPGEYSLINNPYPSPVDFTAMNTTSIDRVFYLWDPFLVGTYGLGGYQTFAEANNYEPLPGGTAPHPSGVRSTIIQSGEAFFIHADIGGDPFGGFIGIDEDAKVEENPVTFTRPNGGMSERHIFRTALTTPQNVIVDANAVAFSEEYSDNIDIDDARKILNSFENFGIRRNNTTLAVEARSRNLTDTIFYQMSGLQKKGYRLCFVPVNIESNTSTWLIDNFTGTKSEIQMSDTTYYDFTVNANAGSSAAGRFMVVFEAQGALPVNFIKVAAHLKSDDVVVEWQVADEKSNKEYVVLRSADGNSFSAIGTVPARTSLKGAYSFTDVKPLSGWNYFRIKNVDLDGKVQLSDIVKVYAGIKAGLVRVYPNPVSGSKLNVNMNGLQPGKYAFKLYSQSGQVVSQLTRQLTTGNELVVIDWPESLPRGVYSLEIVRDSSRIDVIRLTY